MAKTPDQYKCLKEALKDISLSELEVVIAQAVTEKIGMPTSCNIDSFAGPLGGGSVEIKLSLRDETPSPFD